MAIALDNEHSLVSRWTLHYGDSRTTLHPLLQEVGSVDMFVSGSDHSYEVQKAECEEAKQWVKHDGIIVVDRPDYNGFRVVDELFPLSEFDRVVFSEKCESVPYKFAVIRKREHIEKAPHELTLKKYHHVCQQIALDDTVEEFEKAKEIRQQPFLKFMQNNPGDKILEVGCGRGLLLKQLHGERVGIDIATIYLRKFKDGYERLNALVEHLPFKEQSFDRVIADCVLEHVMALNNVLSEIHRVLKSHGRLYVVVPHDEDLSKYRWQLEEYGMVEHQRTFYKHTFFPSFKMIRVEEINYPSYHKHNSLLRLLFGITSPETAPRFLMFELKKT